jgi:hypothetical protein
MQELRFMGNHYPRTRAAAATALPLYRVAENCPDLQTLEILVNPAKERMPQYLGVLRSKAEGFRFHDAPSSRQAAPVCIT